MYRASGFFLGLILQQFFGIVQASDLLLALAVVNTIILCLVILMRLCAKFSTVINQVYSEYLGYYVAKATECCGGVTLIPQTTTRITTIHSTGDVSTDTRTTCHTATCGILEAILFLAIAFFFFFFVFYIVPLWVYCLYLIIKGAISARVSPQPQQQVPNPDLSGSIGVFNM